MLPYSLLVSVGLVVLGLAGLAFHKKVDYNVRKLLISAPYKLRNVLRWGLYGIGALLLLAGAYGIYDYVQYKTAPTLAQEAEMSTAKLEQAADYIGNHIAGAAGSAGIAGLSVHEDTKTGHDHTQAPGNHPGHQGVGHSALDDDYHYLLGLPKFRVGGTLCDRTIKDSGSCGGLSRFFVDDQLINTCNKLKVHAPIKTGGYNVDYTL